MCKVNRKKKSYDTHANHETINPIYNSECDAMLVCYNFGY